MPEDKLIICRDAAKCVKKLVFDVVHETQTHHVGSITSCLDILVALYFGIMDIDPENPNKEGRDRFILSKGHAALAQYATLTVRGYCAVESLNHFGKDGSVIGGHPDRHCLPGIEVSTGSLGHGLPIGAGMALAAKRDGAPGRTFVLLSDGECNEGTVWEAAQFAGHHHLDNLVAIIDHNGLQAFGRTKEVLHPGSLADRFESFGWQALEVDGHDLAQLLAVLGAPSDGRPRVVVAQTLKGKGLSEMENTLESHYSTLDKDQHERAVAKLN